jgi:Putative Ig domain.
VKKETGSKLFVNGPDERVVFLDEYFEYKHDILIANVGDAKLTGIKVELNATNVKLDDYWIVGGNGNDTLAAFTETSNNSQYGELANLAKIRLLPDGGGEIKGTLKISADGQSDVTINLTGRASNPEIIIDSLDEAVKYVPYSNLVQTNNMNEWNKATFSIASGTLPDGVTLNASTGEIYGVPQESGTFSFKVQVDYSGSEYFQPSFADLTLTVKDNTNTNVYDATDNGYALTQTIGTDTNNDRAFVLETIDDHMFISEGNYSEFKGFWLNGEKLVEGVDYTSEEGSTKITINRQTFGEKARRNGNNTIAAEFRIDGEDKGELKRTAQNFVIDIDAAVNNVVSLINQIPSPVTLNSRQRITTARNAYNILNSTQKQAVTNYTKLTSAEATIAALEANKIAADKVISLINQIPANVTLDNKVKVSTARTAYDLLTAAQKQLVTNYSKLLSAENIIFTLETDQKAVDNVILRINAIPNNLVIDDNAAVETARKAYDALTSSQKSRITNYGKLLNSEAVIAALKATEIADEADKEVANEVIKLIAALPNKVTTGDKSAVETARKAYNALTNTQKQLVANYSELIEAERAIAAFEAYEKANEKDKAAADKVIALIDAIPGNITLDSKNAVETAREAYNTLSENQKKMVTNFGELAEAEIAISVLEAENRPLSRVMFMGKLVDKNGNSISNHTVEIHSVVQTTKTNSNGNFGFSDVEVGKHTLTVKDESDKILATKEFEIVLGTSLALKEDKITVTDGSVFTLTVGCYDNKLTFLGIAQGGNGLNVGNNPLTGDGNIPTYVLLMLMIVSLTLIIVLILRKKKMGLRGMYFKV